MAVSASAQRYATAAFDVAADAGELDQWLTSLDELGRIMRMGSARVVFRSPAVAASDKRAAIDRLLPSASPLLRNFLGILADRDLLVDVPDIAEALRELVNQRRGIVIADITTAIPLDGEMQQVIAQRLGTYLSRDAQRITIRTHLDPNIIGGVVARVGDQVIDDSVRGRLERLRASLTQP